MSQNESSAAVVIGALRVKKPYDKHHSVQVKILNFNIINDRSCCLRYSTNNRDMRSRCRRELDYKCSL